MSLNEIINPSVPLSATFDVAYEKYAVGTVTATGTLTAASLIGGILNVTGAGGYTLTTPTAALLYAAMPAGSKISLGTGIEVLLNNTTAGTVTLAAGTDVTITNLAVNPIIANTAHRLIFRCTAIGATPTFQVYG